ncbi:MAG: hypothetical protein QOI03_175, partial [Solirubrobacteraceae bacterium]|nr:hypothetical protein [Solirubrobacteraceae bacterium]
APDDPEELAFRDGERDVLKRVQLFVSRSPQGMQRALLERMAALLGDLEPLVDPLRSKRREPKRGGLLTWHSEGQGIAGG